MATGAGAPGVCRRYSGTSPSPDWTVITTWRFQRTSVPCSHSGPVLGAQVLLTPQRMTESEAWEHPRQTPAPQAQLGRPFSTSLPDKQPPLPSPHPCYFWSRATAEGLEASPAEQLPRSQASWRLPEAPFRRAEGRGDREEVSFPSPPCPQLPCHFPPLKTALFFRKIHGIFVSLEWKWVVCSTLRIFCGSSLSVRRVSV